MMSNFICLRHCVRDKMQVSQKFTDMPRTSIHEWSFHIRGSFGK